MPAVTVNGVEVPVQLEPLVEREDLGFPEFAFSGRRISSRTGTAWGVRRYVLSVVPGGMTPTEVLALEAVLSEPGPVDVGGSIMAPGGGSVPCMTERVTLSWDRTRDLVGLSCTLHEVDANA